MCQRLQGESIDENKGGFKGSFSKAGGGICRFLATASRSDHLDGPADTEGCAEQQPSSTWTGGHFTEP